VLEQKKKTEREGSVKEMTSNTHRAGHQPRIVYDQDHSCGNPVAIHNPEVSQAFYGELHGKPDFYVMCSPGPFHLNVQISTPLEPNASEGWTVQIRSPQGHLIKVLRGATYGKWTLFHETFANDTYRQGPSFDNARAPAGDYLIEVSNPATQDRGKYVLATGVLEQFSASDMAAAMNTVARLKAEYWQPGPTRWASPNIPRRGGPVMPRTNDTSSVNKAINGMLAGQSAATAGPLVVLPPGSFSIATGNSGDAAATCALTGKCGAPFPWGAFFFTILVLLAVFALAWMLLVPPVAASSSSKKTTKVYTAADDYYYEPVAARQCRGGGGGRSTYGDYLLDNAIGFSTW
jgi:hypothetical protein